VIEDSLNTVVAPTPQDHCGRTWAFGSWSDGGAPAHNITASQPQTLTSAYGSGDATAPNTTFENAPRAKIRATSKQAGKGKAAKSAAAVKFRFSGNEPCVSFECRLDKKAFAPCDSPLRIRKVKVGAHVFKVRAVDPSGNLDVTPAKDKFRVVKKKAEP
jgi:hypothetical protein